jgi:uncharacterized LabA/DUF88 family protein
MSIAHAAANKGLVSKKIPKKVIAFIDGFNLYHALDTFSDGVTPQDKTRFRKYKWLCLTSLVKRFIAPKTEILERVEYFTTYPSWDVAKRLRHIKYVSAQQRMGVNVTFGAFKKKSIVCRADLGCLKPFEINEEKQTDINIAVAMLNMAQEYDRLILVTADSDQAPALRLLKKLYPEKRLAVLPPIGRRAKELSRECHQTFKMTEQHLIDCQLPNPFPLMKDGVKTGEIKKPDSWP